VRNFLVNDIGIKLYCSPTRFSF